MTVEVPEPSPCEGLNSVRTSDRTAADDIGEERGSEHREDGEPHSPRVDVRATSARRKLALSRPMLASPSPSVTGSVRELSVGVDPEAPALQVGGARVEPKWGREGSSLMSGIVSND